MTCARCTCGGASVDPVPEELACLRASMPLGWLACACPSQIPSSARCGAPPRRAEREGPGSRPSSEPPCDQRRRLSPISPLGSVGLPPRCAAHLQRRGERWGVAEGRAAGQEEPWRRPSVPDERRASPRHHPKVPPGPRPDRGQAEWEAPPDITGSRSLDWRELSAPAPQPGARRGSPGAVRFSTAGRRAAVGGRPSPATRPAWPALCAGGRRSPFSARPGEEDRPAPEGTRDLAPLRWAPGLFQQLSRRFSRAAARSPRLSPRPRPLAQLPRISASFHSVLKTAPFLQPPPPPPRLRPLAHTQGDC